MKSQEIARIEITTPNTDTAETKVYLMAPNDGHTTAIEIDTSMYPLCFSIGHYTIVHPRALAVTLEDHNRNMIRLVRDHLREHLLPGMYIGQYGDIIYAQDADCNDYTII